MTREGPNQRADAAYGMGRLENARAFLAAADLALQRAAPGQNANPILSHMVISAIGFADAVCSLYGGRVNQENHEAAVKTLRAVLGNRLPAAQLKHFQRILGQKQGSQYGTRRGSIDGAILLMEDLGAFAKWAEDMIADRR